MNPSFSGSYAAGALRRTALVGVMAGLLPWGSLAGAQSSETSWHSLFNGKNLSGWVSMNDGVFIITNDCIRLVRGSGWLRSERRYTNFVFEGESRGLQTNYNSGYFLRAVLEGKPFPTEVWQVNLKQSSLGSLLKGSKTVQQATVPGLPAEQWFKFRMEARGHKLTLDIDGQRAWEFNDFDADYGYIGLQAEGRAFDFRNLRIQELRP